jgi:hypothetical protein
MVDLSGVSPKCFNSVLTLTQHPCSDDGTQSYYPELRRSECVRTQHNQHQQEQKGRKELVMMGKKVWGRKCVWSCRVERSRVTTPTGS